MQSVAPHRVAGVVVVALIITATAGSVDAADRWQWSLTPYMRGSDISETLLLDGAEVGGEDTELSDLVDTLDTSLQLHFEGVGDRWGLFADVTYIELEDSAERTVIAFAYDRTWVPYPLRHLSKVEGRVVIAGDRLIRPSCTETVSTRAA